MASIKMITEDVDNTINTMNNSQQNIKEAMDMLNNNVQNLVPTSWEGQSAREFQGVFEEWRSKLNGILSELETLRGNLNTEKQEWIAMQERLSGR